MKTKHLTMLTLAVAGVLLGACKGKTGSYELDRSNSADSVESKMADTTNAPKLVKTGDIRFKVKNVQQTSEKIAALTVSDNGLVVHHEMTSEAGQSNDIRLNGDSVMRITAFNTSADMTVKIPSEKIEDFLNAVSHMGIYVNVRRMDIEDKSLDYLSAQMKLNNRRELMAEQKKGKVIIKDPNAVVNLKDDLVDEQINNKMIDDEVKYSVITLSFYQSNTINREVVANDDPSSYHSPFFSELGMALANGWYLFREVLLGLVNLWVFVVCGVVVWVVSRGYYKRKEQVLR